MTALTAREKYNIEDRLNAIERKRTSVIFTGFLKSMETWAMLAASQVDRNEKAAGQDGPGPLWRVARQIAVEQIRAEAEREAFNTVQAV